MFLDHFPLLQVQAYTNFQNFSTLSATAITFHNILLKEPFKVTTTFCPLAKTCRISEHSGPMEFRLNLHQISIFFLQNGTRIFQDSKSLQSFWDINKRKKLDF